MSLKKTLTIAGTDCSGGAGYAADIKTFEQHDTYGFCVLTSIVSMDPETWSHRVSAVPLEVVKEQVETALSLHPEAIKTGMLPSEDIIRVTKDAFLNSDAKFFVVDPVMVCKGDDEVLNPGLVVQMQQDLIPHATIVTPNLFEAGQLAEMTTPKTLDDIKEAAKRIYNKGAKYVVVKGGTGIVGDKAIDLFYDGEKFVLLSADKIDASYNHGAGCTFAAAVTSNLANGKSPLEAVRDAKAFVTSAIKNGWKMNEHVGVVRHGAYNTVEKIEVETETL